MARKDTELMSLTDAATQAGIPRITLKAAIKAGRMWGQLQDTPRGPVWMTTWAEVVRFKKTYTPHKTIKK